jgi:exodeoxyribonuclease V gamma subunit
MPGLHLYTSNRLEILQQKMATRFSDNPLPPLQREIIVVQSRGMERWLNLEIARQNGICAHVEYLFPRVFVYQLFRQVIELPETSPFAPEINTWRILKLLPELLALPGTDSLAHYVENDPSGLKKYQLSQKIAEVFDRYTIMRPELVTAWDEGHNPLADDFKESRWQAALWQMLLETDGPGGTPSHHAALKSKFLETPDPPLDLPARINVFGISALPPFYIDIFQKIARQVDVDLYYLNPCREYWEYAYSARQIARFADAGLTEDDTYYDCGNSLLASMGSAGREFFSLVLNSIGDTGAELFAKPEEETLLAAVQSDILALQQRNPDDSPPVSDPDTSIRVHACHSPFREVEVLHDQLLDLFAENPALHPTDIVVMVPDVVAYAPLIQAVFDSRAADTQRIPYSIADTRIRGTNPLADTFLAILGISRKRYRAPAVLDILETAAVRRRFGIDAEGLERIKKWVDATGIRWGINGDYRTKLGLPGFHANTWEFGLERMLLGYALPPADDEPALFAGILPYDDIEGDDAHLLGALAHFVRTLFTFAESLDRPRPLSRWADKLLELLTCFFIQDASTENDLEQIRATLTDTGLAGFAAAADLHEPLSSEIICACLEKRIGGDALSFGFISYGVTFCTLLPMRSIPFKVVCLLGMNDDAYPRTSHPPGFDLMVKKRQLCDWSKRQEDRYLFLESILSAREHLLISYVGRSLKDNSDLPPSVLVSELLDYLKAGFKTENGPPLAERLITRHPLQPFSHRYFRDDPHLFSFSEQDCRAARQNRAAKTASGYFPDQPLIPPDEADWQSVSIRRFCRFFNNPAAFLFNNRLKVNYQPRTATLPEEREPFELDALQAYWIKQEMVALNLAAAAEPVVGLLKASGRLPHGPRGDLTLSGYQQEVEAFTRSIEKYLTSDPADPLEVSFTSIREPATTIQGTLNTLYPDGQLFFRCATLKAKDRLNAWVYHLMLNTRAEGPGPRETIVLGKDRRAAFKPLAPDQTRAALEDLAVFFRNGLESPLCFFPETSYTFAETIVVHGEPVDKALQAAKRKWYTGHHNTGEDEDIYRRRRFGGSMPDSADFQETALAIFRPLFATMTEQPLE